MCLIAFSLGQHPDYPVVVAANRDEFYPRPTTAMSWWPESDLLAGKDLQSGGTWLAVNRQGDIAAVTNVREGSPEPGQVTRGELPIRALTMPGAELETHLLQHQDQYAGFNLLTISGQHGWYFSNRDAHPGRRVYRGSYGLSNHLLQSPWPKLIRLRQRISQTLAAARCGRTSLLHERLISNLQDTTPAPDHLLPDTGVALETERFLSSPFISGTDYGTRATTIISLSREGEIMVTEQTWHAEGRPGGTQQFCWHRDPLI
ncbi:NRDE family protein [Marinobacter sp. X15-166B]|uniref:NRDE family protein n=1 Tax=Marinobacter sp. X15-166B TaxID=1897620 RepID=UPI00085BB67B|nr:NRDE family protein [Marinobacter sp. X15-166B]OEY66713.1 hypothetical protein BG841_09780 [Marinobacter sp. X15-166B]